MEQWSIRDYETYSEELQTIIKIITGGNIPGKPIKEEDEHEGH